MWGEGSEKTCPGHTVFGKVDLHAIRPYVVVGYRRLNAVEELRIAPMPYLRKIVHTDFGGGPSTHSGE
jgi:hypothetical protein